MRPGETVYVLARFKADYSAEIAGAFASRAGAVQYAKERGAEGFKSDPNYGGDGWVSGEWWIVRHEVRP